MSGKVKCTCGWSWNKSDSSVKDMYICHECGRDNSNNMKNGGWLDNYNDYEVSAPEGMIGNGLSNVGRNSSPAWGGQFQMGGNLPGAVGNMYARTGSPSKGPRRNQTDVTDASAQNGKKFKLKDEREDAITVQDNFSDRNTLGFNKPNVKKEIKSLQNDAKNSKVVVFAESPKDHYLADIYDFDIKVPKLKKIQSEFMKGRKQIDSIRNNDKDYLDLYNKSEALNNKFTNLIQKYGQTAESDKVYKLLSDATQRQSNYEATTLSDKILPYQKKLTNIERKFYDKKINPVGIDSTFIKEAQNVKKFYDRTKPGTKVDIVPLYEDSKLMQDKLKGLTQFDKAAIFGHSGDKLGGIHNDSIAKYLQDSKVKDCYFGSCGFESHIETSNLGNLKNKTLNYRPSGNLWLGFNPVAKTFDEGMWSRQYVPYVSDDMPTEVALPIKEGVSHKVKKSEDGIEIPNAQNGKEMQYYQQGLDWKPKSINKDGAWLDQYDVAQTGTKKFKLKDERELAYKPAESTNVKKKNFDLEQSKSNKSYINQLAAQQKEDKRRKALTKDQREREDYNARNEERGSIQAPVKESKWDRTKAIVSNPLTAFGYAARNESLPTRFQHGERNTLDNAIDWINPLQGVAALSEIPGELGRGEYLNAGLSALDAVDLGVYAKGAMKVSKPLLQKGVKQLGNVVRETGALASDLTKAKSVKEAVGRMAGLPIEGSLPRLSPEELKMFRQVQEVGRLRATGKPISQQYKYALEQQLPEEHLQKVFGKSKKEIENAIPNAQEEEAFRLANPMRDRINLQRPPRQSASTAQQLDRDRLRAMMRGWDEDINAGRSTLSNVDLDIPTNPAARQTTSIDPNEDALNELMADVPSSFQDRISAIRQQNETAINTNASTNLDDLFAALDAGTHSTQTNRLANNDIINSMRSNVITEHGPQKVENFIEQGLAPMQNASNKLKTKFINSVQDYPYYEGPIMENIPSLHLRGSGSLKDVSNKVTTTSTEGIASGDVFTGSLNTSHSSYLPQLKQVFKYDEGAPQFFGYKPMNDLGFLSDYHYSKDDIAKYLNTEIDAQIKRGILPKNIQRPFVKGEQVQLPHYGVKQFREGGIIKDDRGQWDHPGEITEIGSNEITMKGVPYNVIGVSDTGDVKMMRPGKDYKFKGKKVTEYPMAKNGVNQEDQKTLQQLDQLTNFTNYNKPQPGGWLNKYKS